MSVCDTVYWPLRSAPLWEWVYAGDGKRKIRIVFVGETQPKSLDAESEPQGVAVERLLFRAGYQLGKLLGAEDRLVNLIRV